MRKAGLVLLILLMNLPLLAAQEEDDSPEWDYYDDIYTMGDQTFTISLGTVFPTFFIGVDKHNISPPIGGTGSLSYNYYINANIFAGAEVGGMFLSTLGDNMLFVIPIGLRGGYQLYYWQFEFPLHLTLGAVIHKYLSFNHFSMYLKTGGAAFYRLNHTWSFGITANWFWFPQWTDEKSKNVHGNMIDLTLAARYHF